MYGIWRSTHICPKTLLCTTIFHTDAYFWQRERRRRRRRQTSHFQSTWYAVTGAGLAFISLLISMCRNLSRFHMTSSITYRIMFGQEKEVASHPKILMNINFLATLFHTPTSSIDNLHGIRHNTPYKICQVKSFKRRLFDPIHWPIPTKLGILC